MTNHIKCGGVHRFHMSYVSTVAAAPQAIYFSRTKIFDLSRRFLRRMNTESCQKARQTDESGAGITETNKKIPIHSELKTLIDLTADFLPDPPSPEKRFLRYIVHRRKDLIIMRRQHPPSNFSIFRIDNYPYGGVKDSGFGREGVRYAMESMTEPKVLVIASA